MEILNVLAAGAAAWAFGAVWYMTIAQGWMRASGLTDEQVKATGPAPYVVSLIGAVVVAGMLRHVLHGSGIETVGKGLVTGLGMGAFIVVPWMINNVMYGQRPKALIWMDGGYPVVGMGIMGAVLTLF